MHVLRANWNGREVILKTPKQLGSMIAVSHVMNSLLPGTSAESFKMTRKQFIERVGERERECVCERERERVR